MKILSGNLLVEGTPVWWTGSGWTTIIEASRRFAKADADAILADAQARFANQVVSLEVVDLLADGAIPRRQRIRHQGATVRPDLGPGFERPLRKAA